MAPFQKEIFKYDNLNRLTDWIITHYANNSNAVEVHHSQTYDAHGNIRTRSELDNYTMNYGEGNGRPHALTSIDGLPTVLQTHPLSITYTDFKKVETLSQGNRFYEITYGVDRQRRRSVFSENGQPQITRYYFGDYEEKIDHTSGITERIHYLRGAVYITRSDGTSDLFYTYTDFLGSLKALVRENGTVAQRYAYDPWGNRRNPYNWTERDTRMEQLHRDPTTGEYVGMSFILNRGYTGHEHIDQFGVINMNGRVYDPITAQFFSPDPFIQAPHNWLNFNRYSYVLNNPFKYTDPSGEIIVPIIIGIAAGIGAYQGYRIAEARGYDFNNWQTWGYMLGGAVIGGGAAYLGIGVAAGGGFMANTMSVVVSSYTNSFGMSMLSGGMIQPSINFGFGSLNLGTGQFRSIFDWDDLSRMERIGYGLGALGNISDILAGLNPGTVQLQTNSYGKESNKIGHSQVLDVDGNSLIDFGPTSSFYGFKQGTNRWVESASGGRITQTIDIPGNVLTEGININGVNLNRLNSISNRLNNNPGFYNFLLRSCSSVASRALSLSGAPMIGIHPYLLHAQAHLWNLGVRPWTFSPFLTR